MLGGSCSPCCSPCKPARMPDYIEVDITSDFEDDVYASIRYASGRNYAFFGACEMQHADAYLLCGIKSGTYRLDTLAVAGGDYAEFVYRDESLRVSLIVDTSPVRQWSGAFPNRFGTGFQVSVQPLRIVGWRRQWPTYSALSSQAATQQEMQDARPGIVSGDVDRTIVDGITNIKYSLADNPSQLTGEGLNGLSLFATALHPCVGGDGTLSTTDNAPRAVFVGDTVVPLEMTAGWLISSALMSDDMNAINQFDQSTAANCGKLFPRPYFISASGEYVKTYDAIDTTFSSSQGPISLHVVRYDWLISRKVDITRIVGRMNNGDEVPMI